MVRPGAFDAVVTDLRMPGMDGLQLTARLKAVDPGLPVLLITAFGSLESAREAMRLGAFDFLSKPFSPEELTTALNKCGVTPRAIATDINPAAVALARRTAAANQV